MPSFSGELFCKIVNVQFECMEYEQMVIITAADSHVQTNVLVVAVLVLLVFGQDAAFLLAGTLRGFCLGAILALAL